MILGEEKLCDGTAVACGEKLLRDIGGRGWRTIFATAQPSPTEKELLRDIGGRGWRTIFATAQPSPTEKELPRDADTADYGEGPAL